MTTLRNLRALTALLLLLAINVNGSPYSGISEFAYPSDDDEDKNSFASQQLQQSYSPSKISTGVVKSPKNDDVEQFPPLLPFVTKSINKMKNKKKTELDIQISTRFGGSVHTKESIRNFIGNMFELKSNQPNPIQQTYPQNVEPNTPKYPVNNLPRHPVQPSYTPSNYYQPVQKQESSGTSVANNQIWGSSQSSGAKTYSLNEQNPRGSRTKNVASGIASDIAGDHGVVGASYATQESYHNAQGSGQNTNSQSQNANWNGANLGMTSTNSGTKQTSGPKGHQNTAHGASNSYQQTEDGTSNANAQTSTTNSNQNGVHHNSAKSVVAANYKGKDGSMSSTNANTEVINQPGFQASKSSSFTSSGNGGSSSTITSSSTSTGTNLSRNNHASANSGSNTGLNHFGNGYTPHSATANANTHTINRYG